MSTTTTIGKQYNSYQNNITPSKKWGWNYMTKSK